MIKRKNFKKWSNYSGRKPYQSEIINIFPINTGRIMVGSDIEYKNMENQLVLTVVFGKEEKTCFFDRGMTVLEILMEKDLPLPVHCGGTGACGCCKIKILDSHVPKPSKVETRRLLDTEIQEQIRLACQTIPDQDLKIGVIGPPEERKWVNLDEDEFFTFFPSISSLQHSGKSRLGIAIDFGTTHIRLSVRDKDGGKRLKAISCLNPQLRFGSDILRRLLTAAKSKPVAGRMARLCNEAIAEAITDLQSLEGFDCERIETVAVVGNTAMLALVSRRNYELLLQPEFWSKEIDCQPENPDDLKKSWGVNRNADLNIVPSVAGFIGSDLLGAVVSTRLVTGPDCALLLDFGTNSEIALWDGQRLWVSSAAGGPAFDGCGLSCGIPALPGAIYRVKNDGSPNGFHCRVIGEISPKGICGSGLVDVISILVKNETLMPSGNFSGKTESKSGINLDDHGNILLKKRDIDAFQRAKAAIGAGFSCILREAGVSGERLKRVFVCGSFGRHLNIQNAIDIGLLPDIPLRRFHVFGNAALAGCEELMMSENRQKTVNELRQRIKIIDLAQNLYFESAYPEHLFLKPANK